jgi:radical SAM superfamily enzyme YgiQ (UPF0313 family)
MRVLAISGSKARLPDPVYPLGAAIVATAARRAGHHLSWFDALRYKDHIGALSENISASEPDVFLLSIRNIDSGAFPDPDLYFEDHSAIVALCRSASSAPIVIGGSGFSLMPSAFMEHLKPDCGVTGEGAAITVDLLSRLEKGDRCTGIVHASPGEDPFFVCDRDIFDVDWYYEYGGVANIQTKSGCPYKCIYCTYPSLEGRDKRERDPEAVVDEMASLTERGIDHFFFVDSVFNSPENHAAAVCEEILRRDLRVSFTGYFCPKGDLPEFPSLLKRAGCSAVEFGTDALSDSMLRSYRKGFTVDEAITYSRRIGEQGIPQCHNLILGGPGETEQTMVESVARLDEMNPAAVIATIGLRVYPGTALARMARQRENTATVSEESLDPVFFLEEEVADTIVEKVGAWVDDRKGWICPGLKKRYNARYLARRRERLGHKGVLWPLL